MAGNENSGGYRPTASQNNPANISATGGNGQSGTQPARYISGLGYGQGQETMATQSAAPMAGNPTAGMAASNPLAALSQADVKPLSAPTDYPDMPVSSGAALGPGNGEDVLMLPQNLESANRYDSGLAAVRAMYLSDPSNEDLRRIIEMADGLAP